MNSQRTIVFIHLTRHHNSSSYGKVWFYRVLAYAENTLDECKKGAPKWKLVSCSIEFDNFEDAVKSRNRVAKIIEAEIIRLMNPILREINIKI